MDLNAFMESYATEIGGTYSEYDSKTSIIIVPLADARFQTVLGRVKLSKRYDRVGIEFSSKVCAYKHVTSPKALLEENGSLNHAKFTVREEYVEVEASSFIETVTEDILKEIIQEVANVADEFELKLTGADLH